jgi:aminoglycoside phosphotransferase (APT) family kinase protein
VTEQPAATAAALRSWLETEYGGTVLDAEAPGSNDTGRATLVHLMRFTGSQLPAEWRGPLVARIHQSRREEETSLREASIQRWCSERDYPAPRMVATFRPDELLALPVQVMERVPGITMLDALKKQPWRALGCIDQLARLQLRLHAISTAEWPEGPEPRLAERRLGRVRRVAEGADDPDLDAALERVDRLLPTLRAGTPVACHGDFHPLNVLVAGDRTSVIDWTDAALGDRHGDVARTMWLIRFGIPQTGMSRPQKAALSRFLGSLADRYVRAYSREHVLDPVRLRRWGAVQFLDAWGHAAAAIRDGQEPDEADLAGVLWVRERFESALA